MYNLVNKRLANTADLILKGGKAMLKTITKKIIDKSTDEFFKFEFHCDRCQAKWISDSYSFEHGFPNDLTQGEKRAKEIMWKVEHDVALERANLEARLRFNQCNSCLRTVCDDCFSMDENEDLCIDCAKENTKDGGNKK